MSKHLYCDNCNLVREVTLKIKNNEQFSFRNETLSIDQEVSICNECGEEVYDEELTNKNLKKVGEQYTQKHLDDIKQIRKQFNFSQETFSKILNWGLATIKRYETGNSIPDSTHMAILKMLKSNPVTIINFYHETKNNFDEKEQKEIENKIDMCTKSWREKNLEDMSVEFIQKIYEQHEGKIDSGYSNFDPQKLINMILFFAFEGVQKTKLMKLLWYADFLMFKRYLVSISGTPYHHRKHGPVPIKHDTLLAHLEDNLQIISISEDEMGNGYTLNMVKSRYHFDESLFDDDELSVLRYVDEYFKQSGSVDISSQSHQEEGWKQTTEYELIPYNYADSLSIDF